MRIRIEWDPMNLCIAVMGEGEESSRSNAKQITFRPRFKEKKSAESMMGYV
jgi:hypothetical protein